MFTNKHLFNVNLQRKLLAIYLHHGDSILTNVFCDQVMKNERIIEAFAQNFILYGWDLTFESNRNMLVKVYAIYKYSYLIYRLTNPLGFYLRSLPV